MSTRPPSGAPQPAQPEPEMPPIELDLTPHALDLIGLPDPPHPNTSPPPAPTALGNVPARVIPSVLLATSSPARPQANPRRRRNILAGLGVGAAALALGALQFLRTQAPQHQNDALLSPAQISALLPGSPHTDAPAPLAPLVRGLLPELLPAPVVTPLTAENVDQLDAASLAAVGPMPAEGPQRDVWVWAQFRRVMAFGDESAKTQLSALLLHEMQKQVPPALGHGRKRARNAPARGARTAGLSTLRGVDHFRPLEAAGFAGAALLTQPKAQAARAIDSLAQVLAQTPQGQWVMALSAPQRLRGRAVQAQHELYRNLVAQAPHMVDAQLAWAQLQLEEHDDAKAIALLSPLAMEGAADTWARAAHLMWQAGNTTALSTVLARRLAQTQANELAQALAQASAPHRAILRRLVMRHLMAQGDTVGALSWARAQAEAQPKGVLSQWDYLRLAELNHTALPPQALAVVQGDQGHRALLALSVRLTAERWHSDALRAVAAPLQPALSARPITQRLAMALDAEAQGQRARAISALRGNKVSVQEAPAITALSQAVLASLRPALPADALDALEAIHPLPARLDTEMPRPDLNELYARTMGAADAAQRPAAALRAARTLFWRDPLAQDPMALLAQAAQWDLTLSLRPGAASQRVAAFRAIEQLIDARPTDDALVETAIAMAERGDNARAPGYVATLLKRRPQDPALTARLVEAYLAVGDRAQARAWLKLDDKPTATGEDAPPIAYAKALVLSEEAPQRARTLLNHAVELAPEPRMFAALAELDIKDHQLDDALAHLGRAAQLSGQAMPYALKRARILVSLKRHDEARALLTPWVQAGVSGPTGCEGWLLMADIEREAGTAQAVAQALGQALQAAPERDDVALRLARLQLQELGQPLEALTHLEALVAHAPKDAQAHYFYAVALRETRGARAAEPAFARYLALAPDGEYATDAREARAATGAP